MAHVYKNFPPNGPVDTQGRPLGKCDCGRWEDAVAPVVNCPNAQVQGKFQINHKIIPSYDILFLSSYNIFSIVGREFKDFSSNIVRTVREEIR